MTDQLLLAGSRIVGAVFVATALIKVVNPNKFFAHVIQLGFLPVSLARVSVPLFISLETSLGVALVIAFVPALIFPVTAAALVFLTCLTVWSFKTGKATDCGCYGDFMELSLWQSVALNTLYLVMIAVAWASHPVATNDVWKSFTLIVTATVVAVGSRVSLERQIRTGRQLFQRKSPLKKGHRWESRWAGKAHVDQGENLIAFLGPSCPYCKEWVRVLNVIHSTDALPPVTAVFGVRSEAVRAFVDETGATIPVETISARMMSYLAPAVPTTVLIESGKIKEVWKGRMTPEFRKRFTWAFFPRGESGQPQGPVTDAALQA